MRVEIEVVYAMPEEQLVIPLMVELPITIEEAIHQSGIFEKVPDMECRDEMVGIFGQALTLGHPVRAGDRIEIYRPLPVSPTEARKIRAAARRKHRGRTSREGI